MGKQFAVFSVDFTGVGATPKVVGKCPDPQCGGTLTGWLVGGCPVIQCRDITTRYLQSKGQRTVDVG
jgi:hypothetical protein